MDTFDLPKQFKALRLEKYGTKPTVVEIPVPDLTVGQVMVKVDSAPINPSDVSFIAGHYPGKPLPTTPGTEGSGTVVKTTEGLPDWIKVGTRVSFTSNTQYGSYAQYSIVDGNSLFKLDDDVTFDEGASSYVNPLTAVAFVDVAKKSNATTIIHTAAASSLGKMLVRYAKDQNVGLINIVRREEQKQILLAEGATQVLVSTDENYIAQLTELATQTKATILFDAIGGDQTIEILNVMPNKSTAYVYGGLSGQPVGKINLAELIFKGKTLTGFWLTQWLQSNNVLAKPEFQKELNSLLKTSLKTTYAKEFPLSQFLEAVDFYQKNQTNGKVLVKPNKE